MANFLQGLLNKEFQRFSETFEPFLGL